MLPKRRVVLGRNRGCEISPVVMRTLRLRPGVSLPALVVSLPLAVATGVGLVRLIIGFASEEKSFSSVLIPKFRDNDLLPASRLAIRLSYVAIFCTKHVCL